MKSQNLQPLIDDEDEFLQTIRHKILLLLTVSDYQLAFRLTKAHDITNQHTSETSLLKG